MEQAIPRRLRRPLRGRLQRTLDGRSRAHAPDCVSAVPSKLSFGSVEADTLNPDCPLDPLPYARRSRVDSSESCTL